MEIKEKEECKIIVHPASENTPVDLAISRHMQNMYATFGEDKVRESLKELFAMEYKPTIKKVS